MGVGGNFSKIDPGAPLTLVIDGGEASLQGGAREWRFRTAKELPGAEWVIP